jgi:hypothetical protein
MWEYLFIEHRHNVLGLSARLSWSGPPHAPSIPTGCSLDEGLAILGKEGWELVTVLQSQGGIAGSRITSFGLFFKRPVAQSL